MVKKQILLHLDKEMYYKMRKHKLGLEEKLGEKINWSDYVTKLFGFQNEK